MDNIAIGDARIRTRKRNLLEEIKEINLLDFEEEEEDKGETMITKFERVTFKLEYWRGGRRAGFI